MTSSRSVLLPVTIAALVLITAAGCSNKAKTSTIPESTTTPAESAQPPAEAPPPAVAEPFPPQPVDKSAVGEGSIDELNRQGVLKTVYFGYNSEELDDVAKSTLQANAAWIKAHPQYRIEIGGHCDERGSTGYNVALGDRRAGSVRDYLASLGADSGKLAGISYGEEKPADPGHDESAYAKNRRADFTIKP
jgi:peptidoglycan-associated lipoprotein